MTNKTKPFVATLTMTQDDYDSPVKTSLSFDPLIVDRDGDAPEAYERMAAVIEYHLYLTGVVDREGNLIDEEALQNNTYIDAAVPANGTTH